MSQTNSNWVSMMPRQEAYAIDRILYDVQHDRTAEAKFFADPAAYMADYPALSERAAKALAETDIGQLYLLGSNPYLLRAYCLQLKVPEPEYLGALRATAGQAVAHG